MKKKFNAMAFKHYSVLLAESIAGLDIKPTGIYVDCTLGRAGHSIAILNQLTTGKLYAFEQDSQAIKESQTRLQGLNKSNYEIINANFANITVELLTRGVTKVDGILYDLGVSSPQFDDHHRGFSYRYDSELDMRMNQNQPLTAKTVVNTYSEAELARIFWEYGEEKFAHPIAKAIVLARATKTITTTFELVDIIRKVLPQKVLKKPKHPAKQVFQAIRIEVNQELFVLKTSLSQAVKLLKPNGRLVVITFHSIEDRIVKQLFTTLITDPNQTVNQKLPIMSNYKSDYQIITKKAITPSEQETGENRRSKSAKLRILKRVT
nr:MULTISPECIES: 16S rRNA (cytosine(1402)-N(4))-methyltransferase RsmH [Spiroplasma]